MLLALLLFATGDPLPRCNGAKRRARPRQRRRFRRVGDVRWAIAAPLGQGCGRWTADWSARPALRIGIAMAGLGLAVKLLVWG
jgi:hypothetical protein